MKRPAVVILCRWCGIPNGAPPVALWGRCVLCGDPWAELIHSLPTVVYLDGRPVAPGSARWPFVQRLMLSGRA